MIPVILSGGSGTRLWPISRAQFPKQFCDFFDESLQTKTLRRVSRLGAPWILTSITLRDFTEKKAKEAGFSRCEVFYEPVGKNTAPAIAFACKLLEMRGLLDEVIGVFPADHLIEKEDVFFSSMELAELCARENKVVTLGLKPTFPATGFGYIQTMKQPYNYRKQSSSFEVIRFHEKPSYEVAKEFLTEGNYYWNAGVFIFPVRLMIELLEKYQPHIWDAFAGLKKDLSNLKEVYASLPSISIDYAIMERLDHKELLCVPCDMGWSDVGSWDAVSDVYRRNGRAQGLVSEVGSKNNFVYPKENKTYAMVGVEDLIVVDTDDALLISRRGQSEDVKVAVERLKKQNKKVVEEHTFSERPWGRFEILRDAENFKSKVIRVNPKSQLSYQSHAKREEHWIITRGKGEVVLNDEVISVQAGSYVKIPLGAKHRMRNPYDQVLEFVEVQLGQYFGEDDIVRYQDDYNRN